MPTEGDVLNHRYRILRVLSDKGGMGVIYQATDLSFNNTVVIKHSRFTEQFLKQQYPAMPPEELRSHAEYLRKAFEREARLVRGLKHHALPSVIDYFTTGDGHQFFVMDFIPGKDFGELLDERLRQNHGPFPLDQTLDWADQLLDALDYLHTRFESPIVHRDLKPLNLKLIPDGQIVLLDFGLAKGATPGMSVVSASIHGYTLQYAPLEQIRGKGTSVRSDLYSLAVTLHHLLSGAPPPSAVDRVAETTSGEADPLRPLHEVNPQIPAVISEVIQRAAALNPNERYATAAEMHEALLKAMQPAHHPQPQPPLPPVKEQETIQRDRRFKVDLAATRRTVQPSGNRWKWAAVGGALVLVIGVGIAVSSRHLFSNGSSSTSAKRSSEPAPTVAAPTTPPSPNVKPAPALQSFTENLGNGVKLEMVAIRGGTFEMGSPDGQGLDKGEYPKHSVTVSPFAIGKYEVTQGQWKAVMGSNNFAIMHIDPRSDRGGDNLPLSSVSWNDAAYFCKMLSNQTGRTYRLPTEAEWEYAARAGSKGRCSFSDNENRLGKQAWFRSNSNNCTHPVGQLDANAWGLYDMHGNVWELVQDWYDDNYYQQSMNSTDPQGPSSGRSRGLRGGSFSNDSYICCASFRSSVDPTNSVTTDRGFRVVAAARTR